jgi:hypothetical protein
MTKPRSPKPGIHLAIDIVDYPEFNGTAIELTLTGMDATTRERMAAAIVTVVKDAAKRVPAE